MLPWCRGYSWAYPGNSGVGRRVGSGTRAVCVRPFGETREALLGTSACGAVRLEHVVQVFERPMGAAREHGFDEPRNVGKADRAREKALYRDLVRRVEHGRRGAAGAQRLVSQAQARKARHVRRLEMQ